jgi:hypothetical protein
VKPNEVCAYVQNDGYGMAGLQGFKTALAKQPNTQEVIAKLDQVLAMQGENPARNNIGPVGVYQRSTLRSREGYQSLKNWEATTGNHCRFVATVAVYDPAAKFIGYARYKGENWVFSSPSIAAGNALKSRLKEYNVTDKVIVTQVVPALDSSLPIVKDAHAALGELDYASLEGYMVGRMFLALMRNITGDITRENFLKAARRQPYDMGGTRVDFTTDNQGSDFVLLTYLNGDTYQVVNPDDLRRVFQQ